MKRLAFSILVLVLTLSFTSVYADTSDDIASLERQYFEALENQDEKKMDSLLADDFEISSMTSNWSMNKEDFLKTVPKQVITSQEISAIKVENKGDKAYSQVDISMTKTFDGKDHSGQYEVYSIWVNKEGTWKLIGRKIKFLNPPD